MAQVPTLDSQLIEDTIAGCAFPEAEQEPNGARVARPWVGLPQQVGGATIECDCASGLQRRKLHHGMVAMSVRAGTGAAGIFEKI